MNRPRHLMLTCKRGFVYFWLMLMPRPVRMAACLHSATGAALGGPHKEPFRPLPRSDGNLARDCDRLPFVFTRVKVAASGSITAHRHFEDGWRRTLFKVPRRCGSLPKGPMENVQLKHALRRASKRKSIRAQFRMTRTLQNEVLAVAQAARLSAYHGELGSFCQNTPAFEHLVASLTLRFPLRRLDNTRDLAAITF